MGCQLTLARMTSMFSDMVLPGSSIEDRGTEEKKGASFHFQRYTLLPANLSLKERKFHPKLSVNI